MYFKQFPEDVIIDIYKKYYKYVLEDIKIQKEENNKYIKNELSQYNSINSIDFSEVADMSIMIKKDRENNENSFWNHSYIFQTVESILIYYYSLKYNERIQFKKNILNNNYNKDTKFEKYALDFADYFIKNKKNYIIDPNDSHSGTSGLYSIAITIPFIFETNNKEKLNHWIKLIKIYCIKNNENQIIQ